MTSDLRYEDKRRGECKVIENGKECGRGVRNRKLMLCAMHYARYQRHGGTERLPPHRGRAPGANPATAEFRRQEALRKASERYEKEKKLNAPCMCGHKCSGHIGGERKCKHPGCICWRFSEVNYELFAKKFAAIAKIGFVGHVNNTAVCPKCQKLIAIGTLFDPFCIRRALLHVKRDCVALRKRKLAG